MQVSDITNLIRYKIRQRAQQDQNTLRFSLTDYDMEAVAAEVAAELSNRFTRPVVTFTRNDVLTAAAQAGFQIATTTNEAGGALASPVDNAGVDVYDKLHKIVDWSFCVVMSRLPEQDLQRQLAQP